MKVYTTVRVYSCYRGSVQNNLLNNHFANGWQYEAAHEIKNSDGSSAVDYILYKDNKE